MEQSSDPAAARAGDRTRAAWDWDYEIASLRLSDLYKKGPAAKQLWRKFRAQPLRRDCPEQIDTAGA